MNDALDSAALSCDRDAACGGAAHACRQTPATSATAAVSISAAMSATCSAMPMPRSAIRSAIASAGGSSPYGALFGGVQAGYEHFFASRLMLGVEARRVVPRLPDDLRRSCRTAPPAPGRPTSNSNTWRACAAASGYDMGGWTPFVTGGIAWASTRFSRTDLTTGNEDANPSNIRAGLRAGRRRRLPRSIRAGRRAPSISTPTSDSTGFAFASAPARYDSQYDLHRFRVGLNYHFGEVDDEGEATTDRGPGTWEIHGQTVFVFQGYPPISAPYDGPQQPAGRRPEPRDLGTVGLPRRAPVAGRRALLQPRAAAGLSASPRRTGAGGFPNGEAQRAFPTRATARRACSCARPSAWAASARRSRATTCQLAGERDVSRVTVQAGQYAVQDIFDNNTYAERPARRLPQLVDLGGRRLRLCRRQRRLHLGRRCRAEPAELGGARSATSWMPRLHRHQRFDLDPVRARRLCRRAGVALHGPTTGPARVRLGAWLNRAFAGSYNDAVALAAVNPGLTANDTIAADPPGPHQVRLLSQPRAGAQRRCRRLRPLQLERRPHRDHVLHRHRHQPVGRPVDQGHVVGPARTTRSASPAR